jgi:hypothetical protein
MRRFILTYQREGTSMDIEGVEFSSLLDKPVVLELYPDDEHTTPPVFRNIADMEFHLNEFGETAINWLDEEDNGKVVATPEVPLREVMERFDATVKRLVSNARPYEEV